MSQKQDSDSVVESNLETGCQVFCGRHRADVIVLVVDGAQVHVTHLEVNNQSLTMFIFQNSLIRLYHSQHCSADYEIHVVVCAGVCEVV